jgi:integrase
MSIRFIPSRERAGFAPYEAEVKDLNGKRRRRYAFDEEKAKALEQELLLLIETNQVNINQAINNYYGTLSKRKVCHKQEKRYFTLFSKFCESEGLTFIHEIKHQHMVKLQDWLRKNHKFKNCSIVDFKAVGNSTVNRHFASYRAFLNNCVLNRYVDQSPCKYLENLDEEDSEKRKPADGDSYQAYYKACPAYYKPVAEFLYLTAFRGITAASLRWEDVHFDELYFSYKTKKGYKGRTKEKTFPLIPQLSDLLKSQAKYLSEMNILPTGKNFVFLNSENKPYTASRISKIGNKAIKKAGLEGLVQYSMRYALAKDLQDAGVDYERIKDLMGHAGIAMTRHYAGPVKNEQLQGALSQVRGQLCSNGATQGGGLNLK